MKIPDEAVEAAVKAWDRHWGDRYGDEALEEMGDEVRVALEAAAPIILSHEIEQARLAHLDAVVNAQEVDRLEASQSAAWEAGMRHALAWLGLKQYGDVMAKDNPHGRAGE